MTRILEKHIDYAVLYILLTRGPLTTAVLIPETFQFLDQYDLLSQEDTVILAGRNDTKFTQIIRNIVSHRNIRGNMVHDNLLHYDSASGALNITIDGKQKLEQLILLGISNL